jgi:CheY-like chemotaxis protein
MITRTIRESIHIALQLSDQACTVNADRAQLEQVVMNLVVNARDALSAAGTIEIGLDLVTLDNSAADAALGMAAGKYVVLRVADTGSGISDAVLPHIFEPFFTTKDVDRGTGLGLATVHGIVHQCGGQIRVRSTPGVGTTFLIYLPFADPAVPAGAEERLRLVAAPQKQCILVVEDNRAVREVVVQTLRKERYEVIEAVGGAEALTASRRHAGGIDLLLSDVVMPHMSGIELAERLLVDRPALPIMLMSGHLGDETELSRLSGHAAVRLLRKPFTAAELLRAVEEFVAACKGRAGAAAS